MGSGAEVGGELCVSFCLPCVSSARSGFEESGAGPRKEHARSDSENWRSLREEQEEDGSWRLGAGPRRDGDRWRSTSPGEMGQSSGAVPVVTCGLASWIGQVCFVHVSGPTPLCLPDGGPRSAGWREHGERRRKFDFDLRGERGGSAEEDGRAGGGSHPRRSRGLEGLEEDKDGLPEWCLDDEDEEMGTFDASGAFLPLKVPTLGPGCGQWELPSCTATVPTLPFPQKGPKEPIPEEQELDFQGLEEEEEEPVEGVDGDGPEAGERLGPWRGGLTMLGYSWLAGRSGARCLGKATLRV